ncbi:DUF2867 domain-containing protein [Streptomyces sp. TLI_146]|uniref:DUF2867 domain-containing protein n=1 Tax=Streptomyces sp. TLI_146 TaxID=1938858 RepID=UPI000C70B639|nr:DUF2867 domain-containing protein [Streptomyces sp. TLI_146]PKV82975.1 uncharacterized protein DUF2867 [Streptomyces sp. TLI_146]
MASAVASLGGYDHVDAVAVDIPEGTSAPEFAHQVLAATPEWVHRLLDIRDKITAPFGLHTQTRVAVPDIRIEPGRKLGPILVRTVSEEEVLGGEDDKHLGFRASFAVRPTPTGGLEGVFTTVIRYHNQAGHLYFKAIQPLHNLIIPRLVAGGFTSPSR